MLLTLKQSSAHHGFKSFHDYSPPTPPSTSRFSPALTNGGPPFPPPLPPPTPSTNPPMSTPHRGLPPPAAMALSQPAPGPPPLGQSAPLGQAMGPLPAPPQQWQGAEESMRHWLHAKAEEDKRKQEEEKRKQEEERTRQEGLRLEQRKIEQDILRTSLSGGIPPYMIPIVFAGMGGGNLPHTSLEWAQHYMAQAHQLQQQQLQVQQQQQQAVVPHSNSPPELRRESRQISQYGSSQHPAPAPLPSTPVGAAAPPPGAPFHQGYPMSPSKARSQLPGPSTLPRLPPSSDLPRINTSEMQIQPLPQGPPGVPPLPGQVSHLLQQQPLSAHPPPPPESHPSPSIYFHHWQPPTSQAGTGGSNQPSTPSDVPSSSPKKRKAQGPQQPAPPPSSQLQHHTPPYSYTGSSTSGTPSGRRRGHSRQRSDLSARAYEGFGRPSSRHRHSESVLSPHGGVSPTQLQGYDPAGVVGTPSGQTRSQRTSASERSDSRHHSFSIGLERPDSRHHSFSVGLDVRHDDRIAAERDSSSSRNSGRREDIKE